MKLADASATGHLFAPVSVMDESAPSNQPPTGGSETGPSRGEFVRLLLQHERRLYAYILSLVPRWSDADEIYQETILRLWEGFDRFDPGTNFAAWAIQVAHFQVLTWRKRVKRSKLVFGLEAIEKITEEQTQTDRAQDDARHQALSDCIEKLSDRNRDLLKRCYADGTRIREVAERLDRTVESVYKALQRLRLSLHKCISDRIATRGTK